MNEKTAQKLLKKVVADYDNISEDFDKTRQNPWEEFNEIQKFINDNDFIIDLGCGNGRFYNFIKDKKNIFYLGVDNNNKFLNIAKKRFINNENKQKVNFLYGNLFSVPFKSNNADKVIAIASFHHLPSNKYRIEAFNEAFRLLKNKGLFIVSVWNLFQPKYKKYVWEARFRAFYTFGKYDFRDTFIPWGKSGVKRYYYAFTQKEIEKILKNVGFKIIKKSLKNNLFYVCQKP